MNILDSIEWIFFWMNIPDFVLNWILNWIIFRPDSMKKWIFNTYRPGLYSHIRKPTRHLVSIVFWSGIAPQWTSRGILIRKSFWYQIVHVPKLFSLLHWSQNIFCFLCSSTPSHVGKFFRLQWEFQWENDQNKKNGQKSLFRGPKWFPKCLNEGLRGGICIEK